MKFNIPNYVREPMQLLEKNGYECFIVGGAIRNMLLDIPVHDYDLTTNALPEEMKDVFHNYKTIDTGIAHGTLTILSHKIPLEITTYRKDSTYLDHRHPDTVSFTPNIQEDCARRDFTINALCYNPTCGLKDFYHGTEDLNNHMIRCIGDSYERFNEDSLRILRAIRFASQLNFTIDQTTSEALLQLAPQLSYVSLERIHEEWMKFLQFEPCGKLLYTYQDVIKVFLPEIQTIPNLKEVSEKLSTPNISNVVRLSLLLSHLPPQTVQDILRRLKFDNQTLRTISTYIQYKDIALSNLIDMKYALKIVSAPIEDFFVYYSLYHNTDVQSYIAMYNEIIETGACYNLKQLAINGNDLVKLGYKGKEISETLDTLLNQVIENKISNDKTSLLSTLQ